MFEEKAPQTLLWVPWAMVLNDSCSIRFICLQSTPSLWFVAKRQPGKSKEEAQLEKKHELEKRLLDVKGQLGQPKSKTPKKGMYGEEESTDPLI